MENAVRREFQSLGKGPGNPARAQNSPFDHIAHEKWISYGTAVSRYKQENLMLEVDGFKKIAEYIRNDD